MNIRVARSDHKLRRGLVDHACKAEPSAPLRFRTRYEDNRARFNVRFTTGAKLVQLIAARDAQKY